MADSTQLRAVGLLEAVTDARRRLAPLLDVPPTEAQWAAIHEVLKALAWAGVITSAPINQLVREAHAQALRTNAGALPSATQVRRVLAQLVALATLDHVRAALRVLSLPVIEE